MKPETYFKKTGTIYGISLKHNFGKWTGYSKLFTNLNEAKDWLGTEEYDFRERQLCSKSAALRVGTPIS